MSTKQEKCALAPEGWQCSGAPGHEGSCAAWPISHETAAAFYGERAAVTFPNVDGKCNCALYPAGTFPLCMNHPKPIGSVRDKNERHLRRMLCLATCGATAYMDDGEASDASMMPHIDFLRDSAQEIQTKLIERNRTKLMLALKAEGGAEPVAEKKACTHPDDCTNCSWCGFKAEQKV